MNIVFVLDSYDRESLNRSDFFAAVLQSLSKYLALVTNAAEAYAREQLREGFVGKQC